METNNDYFYAEGIPKRDLLIALFEDVGTAHPVDLVLEKTGIETDGSLKTHCWQLRDKKKTPPSRLMDLRFKFGMLKRVH